MKILILHHVCALGGAEKSLLDLLYAFSRLSKDNHEIILASAKASNYSHRVQKLGFSVDLFPFIRLKRTRNIPVALQQLFHLIYINILIFAYIQKERIHVVHANSTNAYVQCLGACKFARIPVIWHVRDYCKSKTLAKLLIKFAAQVITISDFLKESFAEHTSKKVLTIYNGVKLQDSKMPIPTEKPQWARSKYLLSISQLVPWKKHEVLIDAMYYVKSVMPHLKLFIVGSDLFNEHHDYTDYLKKKLTNLNSRIAFISLDMSKMSYHILSTVNYLYMLLKMNRLAVP